MFSFTSKMQEGIIYIIYSWMQFEKNKIAIKVLIVFKNVLFWNWDFLILSNSFGNRFVSLNLLSLFNEIIAFSIELRPFISEVFNNFSFGDFEDLFLLTEFFVFDMLNSLEVFMLFFLFSLPFLLFNILLFSALTVISNSSLLLSSLFAELFTFDNSFFITFTNMIFFYIKNNLTKNIFFLVEKYIILLNLISNYY